MKSCRYCCCSYRYNTGTAEIDLRGCVDGLTGAPSNWFFAQDTTTVTGTSTFTVSFTI